MKFQKIFAAFTIGLVNQLMLRILFAYMSKENISKIQLVTRGQSNNKLWYKDKKGVITASKTHSVLTKMNKLWKPTGRCVDMRSLCQNISRISFTNLDLPVLKYGRTMEMEVANQIFELIKKET